MRTLVEERARLVRGARRQRCNTQPYRVQPKSRDQHLVYAASPFNAKSFLEAIT